MTRYSVMVVGKAPVMRDRGILVWARRGGGGERKEQPVERACRTWCVPMEVSRYHTSPTL